MGYVLTKGTTLQMSNGDSPETWVTINMVTGIPGLRGGSAPDIDVTNLASTAKEYAAGIPDTQDISIPIIYDPDDTGHVALETAFADQAARTFKVTLTNSPPTVFTFSAVVKEFGLDANIDDVWRGTLTLKRSGAVTKA